MTVFRPDTSFPYLKIAPPLDQLSEGDREAFNSMARELKKLDPAATHIEELE